MGKVVKTSKRRSVRFSPTGTINVITGTAPTMCCVVCGETVHFGATATYTSHNGRCWHRECLACVDCGRSLPEQQLFSFHIEQRTMCIDCWRKHDNNNNSNAGANGSNQIVRHSNADNDHLLRPAIVDTDETPLENDANSELIVRRDGGQILRRGGANCGFQRQALRQNRVCQKCGHQVDLSKWHSFVTVRNRDWHTSCATCAWCGRSLPDRCDIYCRQATRRRSAGLVCSACAPRVHPRAEKIDTNVVERIQATVEAMTDRCRRCADKVYPMECVSVASFPRRLVYHRRCFRCTQCVRSLSIDNGFVANGDVVLCTACSNQRNN